VARRAPDQNSKGDLLPDFDRLGPDIVGIFHRTDGSATVEGDIEFARQIIKDPIVDDDLRKFPAKRHHVDQLAGIDSGSRVGGEIPDVVRPGTARVKSR